MSAAVYQNKLLCQVSRFVVLIHFSGLHVCVLNCLCYRPQNKSTTVKKQLSQKGRKSRKQESSPEDDDDDDDEGDDDDEDDEEDTPKRQTRRRGATKVKRCNLFSVFFFPF